MYTGKSQLPLSRWLAISKLQLNRSGVLGDQAVVVAHLVDGSAGDLQRQPHQPSEGEAEERADDGRHQTRPGAHLGAVHRPGEGAGEGAVEVVDVIAVGDRGDEGRHEEPGEDGHADAHLDAAPEELHVHRVGQVAIGAVLAVEDVGIVLPGVVLQLRRTEGVPAHQEAHDAAHGDGIGHNAVLHRVVAVDVAEVGVLQSVPARFVRVHRYGLHPLDHLMIDFQKALEGWTEHRSKGKFTVIAADAAAVGRLIWEYIC